MATGRFIGYLRVSTSKQGSSGLGLEAQRESIHAYMNGGDWQLLQEFVEVESGKKDDRTQLRLALEACKRKGAALVIAKLDRLSRDVAFIANLMKSGVDFVACDFPQANKLTIHLLAAVAEHEREMCSKRTKEALAAAKARGVKLGTPDNLKPAIAKKGRVMGVEAIKEKADSFADAVCPTLIGYLEEGLSLNAIARKLNEEGVLTARGKAGSWTARTVKNVLDRVGTGASL
jgi:DNA invertase Pin-like site-specific DNA recombinase